MSQSSGPVLQSCVSCCLLLLAGCADLAVRGTSTESFLGSALKLESTVHNQGARTAGASTASFEMRVDSAAPYSSLGSRSIPALSVGQELEVFVPFAQFQLIAPGTCGNLRVCADSADAVNEGIFGGESNNCQVIEYCR